MPLYAYVALTESGASLAGESVAASEEALRTELSQRGLLVQKVRSRARQGWLGSRRVPPEELALFNQEFMALARAGLTVPDALALASQRPDCPRLGKILQRVHEDIRGGVSLYEACSRHPEAFDQVYLAALRTGEKTGDFAPVLARYHEYLRHRVAVRKKFAQALAYPAVLLVALAVILAVLFLFVMPRFVAMYADLGAALPYPTRVLLGLVENLHLAVPLLVAAGAGVAFLWRRWRADETGRRQADRLLEHMPYVGALGRIVMAAQLARSLSALLAAGTPLIEALQTAAGALTSWVHRDRLQTATRRVTDGESLAQAVRGTALLPATAVRMIEVGEASGRLEAMLAEVAEYYEQVLDRRLSRAMALIEPLLMLLMGVFIGAIIVVMYLPIFHMADVIK
jgi:type IV pilus assembly protein PilC